MKTKEHIWYDVVIPDRMKMGRIHDVFGIAPLTSLMRDYLPCGPLLPLDIFADTKVTLEYIYQCLSSVSCCEQCTIDIHDILYRYCIRVCSEDDAEQRERKYDCDASCCVGNFYMNLTSSMKANLLAAYNVCKFTKETKNLLIDAKRIARRFECDPLEKISRGPISLYRHFEEDAPARDFCSAIYEVGRRSRRRTEDIMYDGYFFRNFGQMAIPKGTTNPNEMDVVSILLFGNPHHLDSYRNASIALEPFSSVLVVSYDRITDSKLPISTPMRNHMKRDEYDLLMAISSAVGASSHMKDSIFTIIWNPIRNLLARFYPITNEKEGEDSGCIVKYEGRSVTVGIGFQRTDLTSMLYFIDYKPFKILYIFNLIVRRFVQCSWKKDMLETYYFRGEDSIYSRLGGDKCKCRCECEMIKDLVDPERLAKLIGEE